jgi:hypothetical protein
MDIILVGKGEYCPFHPLVRPFVNHLFDNYQQKLRRMDFSHEKAAREAMKEEIILIKNKFKP